MENSWHLSIEDLSLKILDQMICFFFFVPLYCIELDDNESIPYY